MVVIKHAALLVAGILSLGLAFPDNNDWGNNPGGASHGPPGTGVTGGGMPTGAPGGNGGNAGHGGYGNPQYGGGKGGPGGPGGDEGDKKDGGQFGGKDHAGAGKPGGGQGPGGWVGGNGNPPNGQGNKSGGGQGQGGWSGGNGNPPDDHGAGWDKNGGGQDGGVHPRDDESGSFRGKGGPGKGMTDHASKPPKERVKHPRDDHDGNKKDWKIAPHDTGSGRPRGPLGHVSSRQPLSRPIDLLTRNRFDVILSKMMSRIRATTIPTLIITRTAMSNTRMMNPGTVTTRLRRSIFDILVKSASSTTRGLDATLTLECWNALKKIINHPAGSSSGRRESV